MLAKILPKGTENKIYLLFAIVAIFLSFLLSTAISMTIGKPIGGDFWYHIEIAESYARGENAMFKEEFMNPNMGPYPPLFHLIFVPFIRLGIAAQFALLLQMIFYPLALFASVFIVYKKAGIAPAAFVSVMLLSSIAFFDRSVQVTPQALDMIFFPLAIYFFMQKRRVPFIISMLITIYSHGVFGLLILGSLVIYSWRFKTGSKFIIQVLVASIPLIMLTLVFLPSYFGSAAMRIQNPQENLVWQNPLYFFEYLGWVPVSLFSVSSICIFLKRRDLDRFNVMLFLWFFVLLVLIPFYPDRFCTYAVVPMCMISSGFLFRMSSAHGKKFGLLLLIILFMLAMQPYLSWWHVLGNTGNIRFDVR